MNKKIDVRFIKKKNHHCFNQNIYILFRTLLLFSMLSIFPLLIIFGYANACLPSYINAINITIVRDNGSCLKYNSDKMFTTPTFSSCKDKPIQTKWEQQRFNTNKCTICIPNQPICLGVEQQGVKLIHLSGLMDKFLWSSTTGRNNTEKLIWNKSCADVSRIGNNIILSKCDDKSKTQEFTFLGPF